MRRRGKGRGILNIERPSAEIEVPVEGFRIETPGTSAEREGNLGTGTLATNSFGTATSTRTVIVEAPANMIVTDTASTTPITP